MSAAMAGMSPAQTAAMSAMSPAEMAAVAAMSPAERSYLFYQYEHINDDRRSDLIGVGVSMAVLSTLAILGRFACRKRMRVAISWDDYAILAGWTCKMSYVFQIFYAHALTLIKSSILLFYCRLFPRQSTSKSWTACVYGLLAIFVAWYIAATLVVIFQCRPISYYWMRQGDGQCIDEMTFLYFAQAMQVLTDVLTLTLPIPVVWKLQLPRNKKFGVLGIFLLGSL
ncbi:MAG: hypothetical protein Q9169_002417 [Polycauliona sp. 2 TL-2023]